VTSRVEVEELSTQALVPRSRSRIPVTGVIATVGLGILLAGGLGLLGGRGGGAPAAPASTALADARSPARRETAPPAAPRVTPWAPCGDPVGRSAEPVLTVEGHEHSGTVVIDDSDGPTFPAAKSGARATVDVVEIPMDSDTQIWITGGRCALAWDISLVPDDADPATPIVLQSVTNVGLDPATAAQNRFAIVVAPHAGDHALQATFQFPDAAVRATWRVHVPELEAPAVRLLAGERPIQTVVGCDVALRLVNGIEEPLNACGRDVAREPARRTEVTPGEQLEFGIDGWVLTSTTAYCGQLEGRSFIPRVEPPCLREQDLRNPGMRFGAPSEPGPWTLAMSTCATRLQVAGRGFEELCGTWYANILVRD